VPILVQHAQHRATVGQHRQASVLQNSPAAPVAGLAQVPDPGTAGEIQIAGVLNTQHHRLPLAKPANVPVMRLLDSLRLDPWIAQRAVSGLEVRPVRALLGQGLVGTSTNESRKV